jgi:hypothetical protein
MECAGRRGFAESLFKGRVAEALVEAVFTQAGYRVTRVGRETRVEEMLRLGSAGFTPDLMVSRPWADPNGGPGLHRQFAVEVKFRSSLDDFLRYEAEATLGPTADEWLELYFVLVTDRPGLGRSCFQVLDVGALASDGPLAMRDLQAVPQLDVPTAAVAPFEGAARAICRLVAPDLAATPTRKAAAPMPGRDAGGGGGRRTDGGVPTAARAGPAHPAAGP